MDLDLKNPADGVVAAVDQSMRLASTWLAWDGRPRVSEDGMRVYTPHKAVRRIADHLIDHLAEVEALLAGQPTRTDRWHASSVTMAGDWARFTEVDLEEANERVRRLAATMQLRYLAVGSTEWDRPREASRTLREIAEHLSNSWYAEQVGDLSRR